MARTFTVKDILKNIEIIEECDPETFHALGWVWSYIFSMADALEDERLYELADEINRIYLHLFDLGPELEDVLEEIKKEIKKYPPRKKFVLKYLK